MTRFVNVRVTSASKMASRLFSDPARILTNSCTSRGARPTSASAATRTGLRMASDVRSATVVVMVAEKSMVCRAPGHAPTR